jgi:hypothetical protein
MFIAFLPLAFAIVGLLLYGLGNGKIAEVGRILFFCGALVTTMSMTGRALSITEHEAHR